MSLARKGGDTKSFFAAGGAVPWWIAGLSLFMSFFSAGTFVVWGAIAYADGMVAVAIQSGICLAGFIVAFFIAPRWNRTRTVTAAQFIQERLGKRLQKIYSILFLLISLLTAGGFLYPVGKIIEVSTGFPLENSILLLGLMIIAYTAVGGLWAVLVTDVLQFVVLTAAVLIVVPLGFERVGGLSTFIEQAPIGFFSLQTDIYTWVFLFALMLYNVMSIGGNWAFVQRYTSVASPRDAKKVGLLFGVLYAICPFIWMLPPMIYRVLHPELTGLESEGAYLMISKEVLPAGLLGLVLGSMVFATASSVNTTFNIASAVFTNDIYKYFRKESSNAELMRIARISTIAFGCLTVTVALLVPVLGGIVEVVFSVGAITGGAMFLPPIWALFSRRQTAASVLSATIASLCTNLFFKFLSPVLLQFSLSRAHEMLLGVLGPVAVLAAFELYYLSRGWQDPRFAQHMKKRALRKEAAARQTLVASASGDNSSSKKVLGNAILSIGVLILLLGLAAQDGQVLVLSMGALISVVAIVMRYVSRIRATKYGDRNFA